MPDQIIFSLKGNHETIFIYSVELDQEIQINLLFKEKIGPYRVVFSILIYQNMNRDSP